MATNNVNNNASPYISAHSIVLSEGTSAQVGLALALGQVPYGQTSADPIAVTLTSLVWSAAASTPISALINNGYVITDASTVTVNLPAIAAVGSVIGICGLGAGGWILAANTGQTIKIGNQTSTTAGSISSSNLYDCIEVVCVVANTTWVARNWVGNLTYA